MNSRPMLVSAGMDATIRFWDVVTRKPLEVLTHKESQINCLAISPDSSQLAAAGWEKVRIYDTCSPTTQNMHTFQVHEKNVTTLGFQAEGYWMFTGGEDGMAKIWDMRANHLTCQRIFQVNTAVHCVALHPNQIELIVADSTGALYLWDLRSDRDDSLVTEVDLSEYVVHVELDQTGRQCAAVTNRGHLFMWNIHSGTLAQTQKSPIETSEKHVYGTPEGQGLMEIAPLGPAPPPLPLEDVYSTPFGVSAASPDALYTLMSNIRPSAKVAAHETFTLKCHFTPDGLSVATSAADYTAKIWSATDFKLRREFRMPTDKWVWECAFTNDSKYMFTASSDGFMRMWGVDEGKEMGTYQGHTMAVTAMAFKDVNYY